MSFELCRVAALLLREAFGLIVEQVGNYLIKNGAHPLPDIEKGTELTKEEVKKSLCVLLQHQLATCHQKKPSSLYCIDAHAVLLRVQIPRWIHAAKELFDDAGELIVEDILLQGHTSKNQCMERVSESYDQLRHTLKPKFQGLVECGYIVPVEILGTERDMREGLQEVAMEVRTSGKRKRETKGAEEPKAKKRKTDGESEGEAQSKVPKEMGDSAEALWRVNFDRFQQYLRDQAIVCAVARLVNPTAATVVKTILSLSCSSHTTISTPRTRDVFFREIAAKVKLDDHTLEQHLKVLVDHQSGILQKSDDSGGGGYSLNFKKASEMLCRATIEVIVRERYGSKTKYLRVFRLLLEKKLLDQKQVSDMAMIPSKEAKEILYALLAEKLVHLQEIPKTPDYAPSRTFYLFSVQLLPVAIMVREKCYKALGNLIARSAMETNDNKRLLERAEQQERSEQQERQQVELKKGGVEEEEEEEMEDVLTPDEKKKVEEIKKSIKKLEHAQLQLEETIMTISNYITLHMDATPAR